MPIRYLEGDATQPIGSGPKIIAHICNDAGGWGAGFSGAISKRWKDPEIHYRTNFSLGRVELGYAFLVNVERDLYVVNMVAQHGYTRPGQPAIDYGALQPCLGSLAMRADVLCASIHMPRIGCGLAGGSWNRIEPLLQQWVAQDHDVFVYDFAN